MSTTIRQVSTKLKALPDALIKDVEKYIDFLTFKHAEDSLNIPQWHKDVLDKRIKDNKNPIDAFEMLDQIENEEI